MQNLSLSTRLHDQSNGCPIAFCSFSVKVIQSGHQKAMTLNQGSLYLSQHRGDDGCLLTHRSQTTQSLIHICLVTFAACYSPISCHRSIVDYLSESLLEIFISFLQHPLSSFKLQPQMFTQQKMKLFIPRSKMNMLRPPEWDCESFSN